MDTVILHGNVLTPHGILEDGAVWMRGETIQAVVPTCELELPPGASVTDAGGLFVSPGFIDAHCHGAKGFDFMACRAAEVDEALSWLASRGVTAVLPTLASSPFELELEMLRNLKLAAEHGKAGAVIAGIHLEGPYISPEKRGAQPADAIRLPNLAEMRAFVEASGHLVRLVTLAPELPGALDLVRSLVDMHIIVSAGHSNATYDEMLAAIEAGVTRVAHLYNGMSPFNHREPGVAGAALEQDRVYAELVMDGIHVHPAAGRIALRAKGIDRLVLVSDATQATGLGDGVYVRPGNRKIIVKDGAARLESGSLAGSTLSLDRAVANARRMLGLSLEQAVQMASWNAANSLNLAGMGRLAPGCLAHVIIFDAEVNIRATFIRGLQVFQA